MSRKDLLFAYVFEFNGDFLEFGSELGLGPLEVAASEAGLFKKVLQFLDSDTQLASEKKRKISRSKHRLIHMAQLGLSALCLLFTFSLDVFFKAILPHFFHLLGLGKKFFVISGLEGGELSVDTAELGTEVGGGLGLFLITGVQVVVVTLQGAELNLQVLALL